MPASIFIFLFLILMPHLMIKQIMLAISPLLARVPPSGNGLSSAAYLTPHRRYVLPRLHLTAGLPKQRHSGTTSSPVQQELGVLI